MSSFDTFFTVLWITIDIVCLSILTAWWTGEFYPRNKRWVLRKIVFIRRIWRLI